MAPHELETLLATMLTGAAGGTEKRWRKAVGPVELLPISMNPRSNWRVHPSGTAAEVDAVSRAADLVREAHPYVDRG